MSTVINPQFLVLGTGRTLSTVQVQEFYVAGNSVIFRMADSKVIEDPYSSAAAALVAFAAYRTLLGVAVSAALAYVAPGAIITTWAGGDLAVYGSNLSSNAPAITINGVALSTSWVSAGELAATFVPGSIASGTYDVVYSDGDGGSVTLEDGITIYSTEGTSVNPVVFSDTLSAPAGGYTPLDPTLGAFWFGVGGTFYSWNPGTLAWVGIITL